jgi:hypothetical protein
VIYEKDGHGLVVSLMDIGVLNWDNAKIACDNFVINGYSDWQLPAVNELEEINKKGMTTRYNQTWSGTEYSSCGAWPKANRGGVELSCNKDFEYYVRPVRNF